MLVKYNGIRANTGIDLWIFTSGYAHASNEQKKKLTVIYYTGNTLQHNRNVFQEKRKEDFYIALEF